MRFLLALLVGCFGCATAPTRAEVCHDRAQVLVVGAYTGSLWGNTSRATDEDLFRHCMEGRHG